MEEASPQAEGIDAFASHLAPLLPPVGYADALAEPIAPLPCQHGAASAEPLGQPRSVLGGAMFLQPAADGTVRAGSGMRLQGPLATAVTLEPPLVLVQPEAVAEDGDAVDPTPWPPPVGCDPEQRRRWAISGGCKGVEGGEDQRMARWQRNAVYPIEIRRSLSSRCTHLPKEPSNLPELLTVMTVRGGEKIWTLKRVLEGASKTPRRYQKWVIGLRTLKNEFTLFEEGIRSGEKVLLQSLVVSPSEFFCDIPPAEFNELFFCPIFAVQ